MGSIQSNPNTNNLKEDIEKVNNITSSDLFKKKTNCIIYFSINYGKSMFSRFLPYSMISVNIVKNFNIETI
jgi:hypothetical protein